MEVLTLAAAALVVAVAVAAFLRVRSGLLPGLWFDPVLDTKALRVRRLSRRRWTPAVAAVGHSIVFDWLEPEEFRRADGRKAYNAGANFTIWEVLADWLAFVLSRWRPEVVVLGFSAVDVNANGILQAKCVADHRAFPAGKRAGVIPPLSVAVERVRALRPRPVARALKRGREALPISARLIGPWGEDLHKTGKTYVCNEGFQKAFRDKWLVSYAVGARELDLVGSLVATVRRAGVRPVVVWAPVTADYVALLPRGAADLAEARAAIHDVVAREGARWLEPPDGMLTAEEHFADPIHLNDRGTRVMTRWLAEQGL